uniref:Si:dkey-85k7.10 n=1 Tax=Poecilia formosa TaxID=48698 RepID=A0A087XS83_POEFO
CFSIAHVKIDHTLILSVVMVLTSVALQGVQAGVVSDFNHAERCKDSLYMGTPPRGYLSNAFKKICQRYEDKPRYATVYDPRRHIPIFSAYTFKKSDGEKKVDFPWMFEPQQQLASEKSSSNMEPFPQSTSMHMNFEDTQAVLEDYADVVQYERGQLNPDEHQADPLDKASTYSLTNVVPQIREFNLGMVRTPGHRPQTTQQLLQRKGLRHHRGHHVRTHDPPQQHGPGGRA